MTWRLLPIHHVVCVLTFRISFVDYNCNIIWILVLYYIIFRVGYGVYKKKKNDGRCLGQSVVRYTPEICFKIDFDATATIGNCEYVFSLWIFKKIILNIDIMHYILSKHVCFKTFLLNIQLLLTLAFIEFKYSSISPAKICITYE